MAFDKLFQEAESTCYLRGILAVVLVTCPTTETPSIPWIWTTYLALKEKSVRRDSRVELSPKLRLLAPVSIHFILFIRWIRDQNQRESFSYFRETVNIPLSGYHVVVRFFLSEKDRDTVSAPEAKRLTFSFWRCAFSHFSDAVHYQ